MPRGFFQVLGHLATTIMPELPVRERANGCGIVFIGGYRYQHLAPGRARQVVERINAVRSETVAFVLRVKLEAADDLILKPKEPCAGQVAHRGGEDAILDRSAAGIGVDGQLDFIGRIAALRDHQTHAGAIVKRLDSHNDLKFLDAGRSDRESRPGTRIGCGAPEARLVSPTAQSRLPRTPSKALSSSSLNPRRPFTMGSTAMKLTNSYSPLVETG